MTANFPSRAMIYYNQRLMRSSGLHLLENSRKAQCSLTLNILTNSELNLLTSFNISFMPFFHFFFFSCLFGEMFYDGQRKQKNKIFFQHTGVGLL